MTDDSGSAKRNLSITTTKVETTQQCNSTGAGLVVYKGCKRMVHVPLILKRCSSVISEFMS